MCWAGILAVVLLHLGLTAERLLPPLSVLDPDAAPAAFYAANLLLFAASHVCGGYPVLRDGLAGPDKGRPSQSATPCPRWPPVAALLQAVVAMLNAQTPTSSYRAASVLLTGMAALGLFLALVGSRVHAGCRAGRLRAGGMSEPEHCGALTGPATKT